MVVESLPALLRYPSTLHLEGSRQQPDDSDHNTPDGVPFSQIRNRTIVAEIKVDATNCGISFNGAGEVLAQSRGHYLDLDYRGKEEAQFNPLKRWLSDRRTQDILLDCLEDRYVMYGEWMHAKHTVFYDALPHPFMEFDVFDRHDGVFLSTERRHDLLAAVPVISVPVAARGRFQTITQLTRLFLPCIGDQVFGAKDLRPGWQDVVIGKASRFGVDEATALRDYDKRSVYKTEHWRTALQEAASAARVDPALAQSQTDGSDFDEGLYIKVEEDGVVRERYKWVRADFVNTIIEANGKGGHWKDRPIIENGYAGGQSSFDLLMTDLDHRMTQEAFTP